MSQFFLNDADMSAELIGQINKGVFDHGFFAIPGEAIRGGSPQGAKVQPGDLITADLINFILARLDALESRPVPTVPTVTTPTRPPVTFVPTGPTRVFDPGVVLTRDPGVLTRDPGILTRDPGVLTRDPGGVLTRDPGVLTRDPGVLTRDPGGLVTRDIGEFITRDLGGFATRDIGVATRDVGNIATRDLGAGSATAPVAGATIRREDNVTVLPGMGRDEATRLANVGIRDIGAVADADATVLGNALGVPPAEAARVIGTARGALGGR